MACTEALVQQWVENDAPSCIVDAAESACWRRAHSVSGLTMKLSLFAEALIHMGIRPQKVESGRWTMHFPPRGNRPLTRITRH